MFTVNYTRYGQTYKETFSIKQAQNFLFEIGVPNVKRLTKEQLFNHLTESLSY